MDLIDFFNIFIKIELLNAIKKSSYFRFRDIWINFCILFLEKIGNNKRMEILSMVANFLGESIQKKLE